MKNVFTDLYNRNVWIKGSGWGSWPENTADYVMFVNNFMTQHNIQSILDVGCGYWKDGPAEKMWDPQRKYLGVDVVEEVIETNRSDTKGREGVCFVFEDVSTYRLNHSYDLILVKDVLMHWEVEHIQRFLKNLPPHRFMLVTNNWVDGQPVNKSSRLGSVHIVDPREPPYNLEAEEFLTYQIPNPRVDGIMETKKAFLLKGDL